MIKSILILFVVILCTNPSWFVSGHNCEESSSHKTNECIFECVKILYDKEYCTSCDIGVKETQINLKPNQTLTSIMQHPNYVYYNDTAQSINTGNCLGCTVNKTDESFFERFKQSEILLRFVNCTTDFTAVNSTNTNNSCEDDEIKGLYHNLTQRLEKFDWCNKSIARDIRNQFFKHKMFEATNKRSNTSDDNGNGTESSVTEQSTSSAEESTIIVVPSHENMKEDVTKSSFAANETETTTKSTVTEDSSTAKSPESTTKSAKTKPTKKKKIVEEHHYMGSVTIIVIIVGVILVILMVSALVLRVFVARRQNIQPRSSSTTYVFDSSHY